MVMYSEELGQYVDDDGNVIVVEPFLDDALEWLGEAAEDAGEFIGDFFDSGAGKATAGAVGTLFGGPAGGVAATGAASLFGSLFGGDDSSAPSAPSRPTSSTPSGAQPYTIKPGDTLSAIAQRFGTTVQKLVQANQLSNADRIQAGDTIMVPLTSSSPSAPSMPMGGFRTASNGLSPTSSYPGAQQHQGNACEYRGSNTWVCPPGHTPPCEPGQTPTPIQTMQDGRVQWYCRPFGSNTPISDLYPNAPAQPALFDGGGVDLPDLPGNAGDMARQLWSILSTTGMARQIIEWLARRAGVKRGKGADMQPACVRELTKQLPKGKKDALRQFLCDFPGPMNLSKDGEETFLALKIAASGYDADQVCPCD